MAGRRRKKAARMTRSEFLKLNQVDEDGNVVDPDALRKYYAQFVTPEVLEYVGLFSEIKSGLEGMLDEGSTNGTFAQLGLGRVWATMHPKISELVGDLLTEARADMSEDHREFNQADTRGVIKETMRQMYEQLGGRVVMSHWA